MPVPEMRSERGKIFFCPFELKLGIRVYFTRCRCQLAWEGERVRKFFFFFFWGEVSGGWGVGGIRILIAYFDCSVCVCVCVRKG